MQTTARPTADDVLTVVRDALAVVLEIDSGTVGRDSRLDDLRVDSLALVELAEIVEERLASTTGREIRIPDSDLERLTTVGDAVDAALARL